MNTSNSLMTIEETATTLRLAPVTVYALARRGELPGVVRIGRSVRVRRASLEEWLAQLAAGVEVDA